MIGVDDDELLCELCDPPLSTVVPGAERIGYEAAELLDRLMAGAPAPEAERLAEPTGVVTRQSTDVLAIPDADVAAAVRFIRERACEGARVADVLRQVPLSRSLLERRFRRYLGRSPEAEIRLVQVKRVKQLLAETDLPLRAIADLAGFDHVEYLSVVFRRLTGVSPGRYRRTIRKSFGRPPAAPSKVTGPRIRDIGMPGVPKSAEPTGSSGACPNRLAV